jgi:exosortase/archaeosortase family protein
VATGQVGIDEACSGIRSFQATLMISLFLGEFYALTAGRRALCIFTGFGLALLLNLVRQVVLVWVAARTGVPAIAEWHDPTGVVILLGCFFALWAIGRRLAGKNQKQKAESRKQKAEAAPPPEYSASCFPLSAFRFSAFALSAWLLLVEAGVEGWYRFHEAQLPAAVTWQVAWPTNNPTYKELTFAPDTVRMLRFSDARNATWQEEGLGRQVIFLHWKPGAVAQRLAQSHTPAACLIAAGHHLGWQSELQFVTVHGLRMPFFFYQLTDTPQPVFVAYCLWNDRASAQGFEASGLDYRNRLAPVRAGIRNPGQRSLEIALTGVSDPAAAQTAVQQLLEKIIAPGR